MYQIFLIGPFGSGTSLLAHALNDHCLRRYSRPASIIRTGSLIRQTALSDSGFKARFAQAIRNGDPLPDGVVCSLLRDRFHIQPKSPMRIFKGFPANRQQVAWTFEQGLMGKNALCIVLEAKFENCWTRYLSQLRDAEEASKAKSPEEVERRHEVFRAGFADLAEAISMTGTHLIEMKTDRRNIVTEVMPRVVTLISRLEHGFSPHSEPPHGPAHMHKSVHTEHVPHLVSA